MKSTMQVRIPRYIHRIIRNLAIPIFAAVLVAAPRPSSALDQWASSVIGYSSQYSANLGSAAQALGAPDVGSYSDSAAAWSALLPDNGSEYISVRFTTPVYATGATIRENFNNGFVTQIDAIDVSGSLHTVWSGVDSSSSGVLADFSPTWTRTTYPVVGLKVTVDTNSTPGSWEEIDAIQLHGTTANVWDGRLILQNQTDASTAMVTVSNLRCTASASISPALSSNWRVAGTGDFDGDGVGDIVVQNTSTRGIAILIMNGNRIASSYSLNMNLPANWDLVACGDVDGDGHPDLIAQNSVTNQISLMTVSGGNVTASRSFSQPLNPGWKVVGAADFNNDGKIDLVVQKTSTNQISVLTLNGYLITGSIPVFPALPSPWTVNAVADFDGDGSPDLLVYNSGTRQMAVLTVVNMAVTSSNSILSLSLTGWAPAGPR